MVEKKTVVYTYGVFDIIHPGHIKLLKRAKALGDYLIVGIVSDEAVREKKGKNRPINNHKDRAVVIESIGCVDEVILQNKYDPSMNLIAISYKKIGVDILTKGDDWKHILGEDMIRILGGKLVKLPYTKEYSTSDIIRKIKNDTNIT